MTKVSGKELHKTVQVRINSKTPCDEKVLGRHVHVLKFCVNPINILPQERGGKWEQHMDFKRVTHVISNQLTKAKVVSVFL